MRIHLLVTTVVAFLLSWLFMPRLASLSELLSASPEAVLRTCFDLLVFVVLMAVGVFALARLLKTRKRPPPSPQPQADRRQEEIRRLDKAAQLRARPATGRPWEVRPPDSGK